MQAADFSGGEATVATKLWSLEFEVRSEPADSGWDIAVGHTLTRRQLQQRYGSAPFGGIEPSRTTPNVLLFTDPVGGLLAQTSVSADAAGYRHLYDFAQAQVPGRRCWAVEGAGSYGAGLAAYLHARGERVVEGLVGPSGRRGAPAPRATPGRRPRGAGDARP